LLLFAHHCGISAERSATFRLLASRQVADPELGLRFSRTSGARLKRERETTATVRGLPRPDVNGKVQNAAAAVARANAQL
jgi:hypothetical protein